MSDRSQMATYAPLMKLLEVRGYDLRAFGSAERGLSYSDALEFIALLERSHVQLLGFEPWRHSAGQYKIESLGVWVPEESEGKDSSYTQARRCLEHLRMKEKDVVTVQFR